MQPREALHPSRPTSEGDAGEAKVHRHIEQQVAVFKRRKRSIILAAIGLQHFNDFAPYRFLLFEVRVGFQKIDDLVTRMCALQLSFQRQILLQ